MNHHPFLFTPGIWIGNGTISFASSKESLRFFTRWSFVDQTDQSLVWLQEVELQDPLQTNRNIFTISDLKENHFHIQASSEAMGKSLGKGVITSSSIAWELNTPDNAMGIETFELMSNGDYSFRSEYASAEHRTLIKGSLWKKSS